MSLQRFRLSLSVIAYGLLISAVATFVMIRLVGAKKTQILKAQTEYSKALHDSKTQLSALVNEASTNRSMLLNLSWGLENSVQKQLLGLLRQNELDSIHLSNEKCETLAEAKIQKLGFVNCKEAGISEGLTWHSINHIPVLVLAKRIPRSNKSDIVLHGQLALTEQWRQLYPGFAAIWKQLDLKYQSAKVTKKSDDYIKTSIIMTEGPSASGNMVATIATSDMLINSLPGYLSPFSKEDFTLPITLVLAAILVLIFLQFLESKLRSQNHEELMKLYSWSSQLRPGGGDQGGSGNSNTGQQLKALGPKIRDNISTLLADNSSDYKKLEGIRRQLEDKSGQLQEQVCNLESNIAQMNEFESLAEQLKRTSNQFLNIVGSVSETTKDLESILAVGLEERGNFLSQRMAEWTRGVQSRGARKYLRSLSETEAEDTTGQHETLLDEHLDAIFAVGQAVSDQAIAAQIHTKLLLEHTHQLSIISSHWHSFTSSSDSFVPQRNGIQRIIEGTELLIKLDPQIKGWKLSNQCSGESPYFGSIPSKIWSASIYHILVALYEATEGAPSEEVLIHHRAKNKSHLLVFTLDSNREMRFEFEGESIQSQIRLANKLLAPYKVACAPLITVSGPNPIAFQWHGTVESAKTNEKQKRIEGGVVPGADPLDSIVSSIEKSIDIPSDQGTSESSAEVRLETEPPQPAMAFGLQSVRKII